MECIFCTDGPEEKFVSVTEVSRCINRRQGTWTYVLFLDSQNFLSVGVACLISDSRTKMLIKLHSFKSL